MDFSNLAETFQLGCCDYAHRGLWSPGGLPENSLGAFLAAHDHGYGIELDVRPSADGVAMVFHDRTLDRMTEASGAVSASRAEVLGQIRLGASDETIPTLAEVLEAWPGTTPILCEIKIDGETDPVAFAAQVGALLAACPHRVAAMSFSPEAVAALPPGLMRGQLFEPSGTGQQGDIPALMATVATGSADYVACATTDAAAMSAWARSHGLPLTVWTVRESGLVEALREQVDALIFEGFHPELAKGT
jgi:glycerophosphoryl diester phosphodiesterase